MKLKKIKYLGILILLFCFCKSSEASVIKFFQDTTNIMEGIDASFIPELRSLNIITYDKNSQPIDMLDMLNNAGLNTIRLRIWHTPATVHSSFEEVKAFSGEIRSKGLKVYIDLHYSDTWADPGHQTKPAAWDSISFTQLKDSVYNYTKNIVTQIKPDYIQIGNEINGGILWPDGNINNFSQFKQLLQSGIQAVKDGSPNTKIILHYAGFQYSISFFSNLNDLDYDIIGLSYYPYWHGKDLTQLQDTLNGLANNFNKRIIIAETTYPFDSLDGTAAYLVIGYPPTVDGQYKFVSEINSIITNNPKGEGVCIWGGVIDAYKIPKPTPNGYYWENQAVLDYNNKYLPVLEALNGNVSAISDKNISLGTFRIDNYPNPFNPATTINYSIPRSSLVTIKVFDILGREIQTLVNEQKAVGSYSVQFNGSNLPSGVYFYRMQAGDFVQTKKLILMK